MIPGDPSPGASAQPRSLRAMALAGAAVPGLELAQAPSAGARYTLVVPSDARARLARGWLALGVGALAASGVLAVLLVLSRTPGLARIFPTANFFQAALVAHVDLSVLVWLFAFAGLLWTINSTPRVLAIGWIALALASAGAALLAIAPFLGGTPVMANYVPVIASPAFLGGLCVFAAGAALLVLRGLVASPRVGVALDGAAALRFGLNTSIVAVAFALIALACSFIAAPDGLDAKGYYELLFWGPGHVLQFAWTLLLLMGWMLLAEATGLRLPLSPRVATLLFAIGLVAVFATPFVYLFYPVTSVAHHRLQTWLMRFGGGLAIAPVAFAVLAALVSSRRERIRDANLRALRATLVASLALFALGGLIGFAIRGSDVRIPAHYHGAIVGVTLACMGVVYWLLPRLGFASPSAALATWQCRLYAGGQLLHILGLVWSGGYGVQRKVADGAIAARSLETTLGMGLMGAGGLIAIVGGMLFVVAVLAAVRRRPSRAA